MENNIEDTVDRIKRQRELLKELETTVTTSAELHSILYRLDKGLSSKLYQDASFRPRLDKAMLFDTLQYLLENKPTPQEAFNYVAELYDKDEEWMKIAKNTVLKPQVHKEVSRHILNSGIDSITRMLDNNLGVKQVMTNAKSPNQSVRGLHNLMKVSDRLDALEEAVEHLTYRQDLSDKRDSTTASVITAMVNMSFREAIREEAINLIKDGSKTRQEISDITGLSLRTLTNYAKEIKEGNI